MLPEHPEEYVVVFPEIDDSVTLYLPGFRVTVVPKDEPANDAGFELLPETVIVKSDGFLLPPDTFVVTLRVPNNPGGGIGNGAGPGRILWFRTGVFFFAA